MGFLSPIVEVVPVLLSDPHRPVLWEWVFSNGTVEAVAERRGDLIEATYKPSEYRTLVGVRYWIQELESMRVRPCKPIPLHSHDAVTFRVTLEVVHV